MVDIVHHHHQLHLKDTLLARKSMMEQIGLQVEIFQMEFKLLVEQEYKLQVFKLVVYLVLIQVLIGQQQLMNTMALRGVMVEQCQQEETYHL